ncbi:hypothetical protein Pcinc_010503 [Petrolisthes cinctipes]|uniref:Deacetylase sirtuin-type domain-containing protein n=1 Tax=Petrolisthes cinctipes TaxID=88211 RepID=A0AAE1G4P2_PETCI|nr:hypothetical protein Pcinc_010503 [Petrolisthes cinctipes]
MCRISSLYFRVLELLYKAPIFVKPRRVCPTPPLPPSDIKKYTVKTQEKMADTVSEQATAATASAPAPAPATPAPEKAPGNVKEGSSAAEQGGVEGSGKECEGAIGGARRDPDIKKELGESDEEDEGEEDDEDYDYDEEEEDDDDEDQEGFMSMLQNFLMSRLHIGSHPDVPQVLESVSVEGMVQYLKSGQVKNVITMAGAGISTSAGIPDFRTPGTGLYSNLEKYNLPYPEAIFDIEYFKTNPKPFFVLARELYPGTFNPTPSHFFIKLLHDKGLLLRHYTQNIDTLEHVAGIPGDKLVEAHGTFRTSHCLSCHKEYTQEWMKEEIFQDKIPKCTGEECDGLVKPDIVFFRESLPLRFFQMTQVDFPKCDLLIILGTSLTVQPFAMLVDNVPATCPRLLVNREKAGSIDPMVALLQGMANPGGLALDSPHNKRDVVLLGECDEGCAKLADMLGWKEDFEKLLPASK